MSSILQYLNFRGFTKHVTGNILSKLVPPLFIKMASNINFHHQNFTNYTLLFNHFKHHYLSKLQFNSLKTNINIYVTCIQLHIL